MTRKQSFAEARRLGKGNRDYRDADEVEFVANSPAGRVIGLASSSGLQELSTSFDRL
jgi:hypothetical protein